MAEACIQEIELPKPKLISFIREVQRKQGSILTLNEVYTRDPKLGTEVILGVVDNVFPVIKKPDTQLQVVHLFEVTTKCKKGELFSVFAFNNFATSLADVCLQKGDFVALCSPSVRKSTRYRIQEGYHQLEAHIGVPVQPNAKILFARKPCIANAGTSKQQDSSTNCNSLRMSPKRHATSSTVTRCSSPVSTGSSLNSAAMSPVPGLSSTARISPVKRKLSHTARMSPVPPIMSDTAMSDTARMSPVTSILSSSARMSPVPPSFCSTARMSPVPSTLINTARMSPVTSNTSRMPADPPTLNHTSQNIVPSTSTSRDGQVQRELRDGAVALRGTWNKYTYTKLSELLEPANKVNIYGVIHTVVKAPREGSKHAMVRLKDETSVPGKEFRVHFFFNHEAAFPKLEHGYILRLHRVKTEIFDGVLDGRVFRTTDVVTFPPDGQGMTNAFTTSKNFYFNGSDAQRLTELRRWIASRNQQQPLPLPAVCFTSNASLLAPVLSSGPTITLLSDIKKAGSYVLCCKVLDVQTLSNEVRFLTITDGTWLVYCMDLDEDERHATNAPNIVVNNPSADMKKIKRSALVQLTNVTVQVDMGHNPSECNWPYLGFKLNGNSGAVKIFKGFEPEAVELKSRLRAARLRDQPQPPDSVDQLMTGQTSGRPRQPNSDNCVLGNDSAANSAVQSGCPQLEMAADLLNCNSGAVQQYVASGGKTSVQCEDQQCVTSFVSCAEQQLNCQPLQKSAVGRGVGNVQQIRLREQCVLTGSVKQREDSRDGTLLSRNNMQQDLLAANAVSESFLQQMAEEFNETYSGFAVGIATGSNTGDCPGTQSIGNQNTIAVHNFECVGDVEMNEVESLASEILPPSEVDILDSCDKFSALTQATLTDGRVSHYQEAETLIFSDDSSDASTVISNSLDCKSRSVRAGRESCCVDQDCGGSDSEVIECTDENEDLESRPAELHCSSNIGCKQMFTSGVHGIPADISFIKRSRLQTGRQEVYLLKAWVKDIEPPINRSSKMDIVSGFCDNCNTVQSYGTLRMRLKHHVLCQCCFQKGKKIPVVLEYLLRLHLIDENDDELIVTVAAGYGVELLGYTVNAFLHNSVVNRSVINRLTALIAKGGNVLLQDRGPMLNLLVTPIRTSVGKEYIVHSTFLGPTQNSEEQTN